MKQIFNFLFYSTCFFFLARSIYRLSVTIPPDVGTAAYQEYQIRTAILSGFLSLLIVGLFYLLERKNK